MTEIKLEGGITVKTFEPPAGFDPFTAKPSDVVGRGFPERPVGGENLERYKRVIGQLKRKANYIVPTFRVNDKFHGPRKRLTTEGTETSTNWSGGVIFAPSGQSFKWIQGDWVVPNVDAPTQNQWYYCASWIGIDGDRDLGTSVRRASNARSIGAGAPSRETSIPGGSGSHMLRSALRIFKSIPVTW